MLTVLLAKETINVPVQEVLSWSSSSKNAGGVEYILMSEMPGVLLKDVWNGMTASQHIKCMQSITRLIKKLCAIRLSCYGTIYHASEAIGDVVHIHDRYVNGLVAKKHQAVKSSFQIASVGRCGTWFGPCELQLWPWFKANGSVAHLDCLK